MIGQPKVSVIIPVYNAEPYLDEAVGSIIGQTLEDIEIICINDGSSDGSQQVLERLAAQDDRMVVIAQENAGVACTRNRGIEMARGEYIYFMDNDDILERHALEACVRVMDEDRLDFLLFDTTPFRTGEISDQTLTGYQKYYKRKQAYPGVWTGPQLFDELKKNDDYLVAVFIEVVRKSFLIEKGIRFEPGISHEDHLYTFQCMLFADRVGYLPEVILARRIRGNSISTSRMSFDRVYGYFYSHLKMMEILNGCGKERRCEGAFREVELVLNNSRTRYPQLDDEEKKKEEALDPDQKCLFGLYVKDVCAARQSIKAREKTLKEKDLALRGKDDEIRKLKKKNDELAAQIRKIRESRAFRVGTALALPLRKVRDGGKEASKKAEAPAAEAVSKPEENKVMRPPVIWLIGTPDHRNLGDHQIAEAALEFLRDQYPGTEIRELTVPDAARRMDRLADEIEKDDILFSMGGGSLGNYWPRNETVRQGIITRFRENRIVVLPQCVQYSDDVPGIIAAQNAKSVYQGDNLIVTLRGAESLQKARALFSCKCVLTPDMVLYGRGPGIERRERHGALICLRSDKEKRLSGEDTVRTEDIMRGMFPEVGQIDMVLPQDFPVAERKRVLLKRYQELADAEVVVTDRLHCMIFAAQVGTPCVVFENDHHKVRESYQWLRDLSYIRLISDVNDLEEAVRAVTSAEERIYPAERLREEFAPLIEMLPRV